jgi:hypothetical protein
LRALRSAADLRDHGLDPRALLVALAVDLLGTREQGLDLAEVDEDVVAVACLLHDARHDLADAVDVLVVHHLALGFADPLQDDLLRGLRGDAAEVLRRDVLALDQLFGNLCPVEDEILVGEERVVLLSRLLLEALELLKGVLACFIEQAHFEIRRDLHRVDAEVALVVEFDRRVPRCSGRLLVGGEKRVLERLDQRVPVDPLLTLDGANSLDDLPGHLLLPFINEVAADDLVVGHLYVFVVGVNRDGALAGFDDLATYALALRRAERDAVADRVPEVLRRAQRTLDPWGGDLDAVLVDVVAQYVGDAHAESMVHALGVVDEDREPVGAGQLDCEHLRARQRLLDLPRDLTRQCSLLVVGGGHLTKNGPLGPISKLPEMRYLQDSKFTPARS